jgi:TonB-linked SusC/RagA family outer membrane protein
MQKSVLQGHKIWSRTLLKTLLVMKLAIIIILSTAIQVYATPTMGQKVNLKLKQTEIKKVLKMIENDGYYRFLYNSDLKDLKNKVDFLAVDLSIKESLSSLLAESNLVYKMLDNNLIVVLSSNPEENVEIKITGKITGENGEALAGVSVLVKGTGKGTFSDNNGSYTLTVNNDATLLISSIGYESQEVRVDGRSVIDIKLAPSFKKSEEVVVIGYGTASKKDLTGSIAKIAGKEIADKPNTNPIASLQGKVAGLTVINNGTPGKAPDIRIRGTNSLGEDIHPLYVVDGIFNDNIDYLNPADIESIEILKDPSSLAIFGVKAANGVIAITTKRGKGGQTVINFNTSFGFKKLVDKIDMVDAEGFKTLYDEEKTNDGTILTSPFDYSKWTANTDWVDAVTRTGKFNTNNLSISTSTDKNKFYMGVGYITDEGIVKHQKLEKILISVSDELKISKFLKLGFNFNSMRQKNPYPAEEFLDQARKVAPIVSSDTKSVYTKNPYGLDSTNQNLYYDLPSIQNSGVVNPLLELENEWNKRVSYEYRNVGSVFGEINFLQDFNFRTTFYADISHVNTRRYTPLYNAYDASLDKSFLYSRETRVNENDETYRKFQSDYILNYKKNFGNHNLTVMTGFTTYYFGYFGRSASSKQSATGAAIPDNKRFWYIHNGFEDPNSLLSNSDQYERTTASVLMRGLYNYKGKYYLNASFRRDGSSAFPDNPWQNFWAVGAAWELTKENFMQNQKYVDFLKLKASTGVLGVQNTQGFRYPAFPILTSGSAAVFGDLVYTAARQQYLVDPDLRWEKSQSYEIGVEMDALSRRLHFEANYYSKTTKDLLLYVYSGSGATSDGLKNKGSLKNSGFEFSASWNQKLGKDLTVTVAGNLTTFKNNVLELATEGLAIYSGPSKTEVGSPVGAFYGYIVEGIYQSYADKLASPVNTEFSYGPGDLKFKDVNGDGVINAKDRTMIGDPTPDFAYGGSVSFKYKGFDAGFDVGGVYGNEVFRTWGGTESPFQRVNYPAFKIDRWHGSGTSNWDPILGQGHRINYEASTYNIEDGSYFRLRNVQLGYNVDPKMVSKLKIKNLRIFVNMQNSKTWKRNLGYTPEFGGSAVSFGVDRAGGAIPSVTTFGLNVTF